MEKKSGQKDGKKEQGSWQSQK